jgi:hypothetical protein
MTEQAWIIAHRMMEQDLGSAFFARFFGIEVMINGDRRGH